MADQLVQWVDADGAASTLFPGSADTKLMFGVAGRFGPAMAFVLDLVPLQPGQRIRSITHGVASVQLPIDFYGISATALRTSIRTWAHRLDPVRGNGKLRVTDPAGNQRELVCSYSDGLERAVEDGMDVGPRLRSVLTFIAEQPYWQDASDTVQTWQLLSSLATFFPFFPLRLSGSEVFADTTVDNSGGDVVAWPVWTITGPGSSPILRNLTTGNLLSLPVTLAAGESVVIDTRPGSKTVTKQDGTNLFGSLTSTSSLWSLAQGSNSIRIELTAATAASAVQLNWRRRYLSV